MNDNTKTFTIAPEQHFAFCEEQYKAILVIVDSRRGFCVVAPLGCREGKLIPVMCDRFEVMTSDLIEHRG